MRSTLSRYTDSQSVYESASMTRRWVTSGSSEGLGGSDGMTRVSEGFGARNISILRYAEGLQPARPALNPSGIFSGGGAGLLGRESGVRNRGAGARAHPGGEC